MVSFEKSVGAVIFRREGNKLEYLLLHYESGHWDFPKGHIEGAESDEETLRREAREETGLSDLKIMPGFKKTIRYFYQAKGKEKEKRIKAGKDIKIEKTVVYYAAETKSKEVLISFEHIGYVWLDYEKALERVTYKNAKEILEEVNKCLNLKH